MKFFLTKGSILLQDSKLVTGTLRLLNDLKGALMGIEAALIIVLMIKEAIFYQAAEQEDKPRHKKNMFRILGIGVFIISLTWLVPTILNYYS